ncbi:MAG: FecR domain-containing protein [Myxococcota bacterium]
MNFERALAWYRARRRPDRATVARLRARLGVDPAGDTPTDTLLRRLVPVSPVAVRRVRDRIAVGAAPERRMPARVRALGGLALAGLAALLALRVGAPIETPERALDQALDAPERRAEALTSAVALVYEGTGAVSGTEAAPVIRWDRGTIEASVTPNCGVALRIDTPEAEVRVVGTEFGVRRDVLGTGVRVTRGHVRVRCLAAPAEVDLLAGDEVSCLPVRAGALLGRAYALQERGAPAAEVLATLDAGLVAADSSAPVRDELGALRISTLANAGRADEARAAADTFLATGGGARRADVARVAARMALAAEGCDAALHYVDAVPPGERIVTDEIARADCLAARDPAAARAALEAALALGPDEDLVGGIRARLSHLGSELR